MVHQSSVDDCHLCVLFCIENLDFGQYVALLKIKAAFNYGRLKGPFKAAFKE